MTYALIALGLSVVALFALLITQVSTRRPVWDETAIEEQITAFSNFMTEQESRLRPIADLEAFLESQRHPPDFYHTSGGKKLVLSNSLPPAIRHYDTRCGNEFLCSNLEVWSEQAETAICGVLEAAPVNKYVSSSELSGAIKGRRGAEWSGLNDPRFLKTYGLDTTEHKTRSEELLAAVWEARDHKNHLANQANLTAFRGLFDTLEAHPLTEAQRLAVVTNEDANLVLAGAGTGKTSVVTAKVCYLIRSGVAKHDEVLVMAYNKKAETELQERVSAHLGNSTPQISTFHSACLRMLKESGRPDIKVADRMTGGSLAQWIQTLIMQSLGDPQLRERSIRFVLTFGGFFKQRDDSIPVPKTLQGWQVKSHQEKEISDWLFLNGYQASYERRYAENRSVKYKPDWWLATGVYLEHFGVDRNGGTREDINAAEYRKGMLWKRELHAQHGTTLLETYSYQFDEGTWQTDLRAQLDRLALPSKPPTSERQEANKTRVTERYASRAAQLCATVLELAKNAGLTAKDLKPSNLASEASRIRAEYFMDYFGYIFDKYEACLRESGEIDFADMCNLATDAIHEGYLPSYRYVLIDEFQDITRAQAKFLAAVLGATKFSRLFAVGDDWQSIYRFAGSEVAIMTSEFEEHFGPTAVSRLDTAFRYTPAINRVASQFVQANPLQMKKSLTAQMDDKQPGYMLCHYRASEADGSNDSKQGPPLKSLPDSLREVAAEIDKDIAANGGEKASVLLLGRQNAWASEREHLKTERASVSFSTVHAAKGLEADYVVVLGLKSGPSSFPSEIGDDPVLELVRGGVAEMHHGEERRLFYVAMTRAKKRVYLMVDANEPSSFADEVLTIGEMLGDAAVMG